MITEDNKKMTFKNILRLDEEKDELREIVDFLKSPKNIFSKPEYQRGSACGTSGTGKTCKAVAGEAGIPFFSISGSDFVKMFVSANASRVETYSRMRRKIYICRIY